MHTPVVCSRLVNLKYVNFLESSTNIHGVGVKAIATVGPTYVRTYTIYT